MIFVNTPEITESDFVDLLENAKIKVNDDFKNNGIPKGLNGVGYETIVYEKMVEASTGTKFEGQVEQTGLHAFPDIIARKLYGVEVKMTVGDKWISTGNSVLETTRIDDVKTIYMFFGKFGSTYEARYRKYQECLSDVGVTHSPRYKIDMELAEGKSIFDKIGVEYDIFRQEENPIKRLKDYYRGLLKEGEELWWIDSAIEDKSVSPVIKSLKLLDESVRGKYINEVFVLFPEIFGNSRIKFERPAAYLITEYNAVSSSLRDTFTAGGKVKIKVGSKEVTVSQLLYNFFLRSKDIKNTFSQIPTEKLAYYWGEAVTDEPIKHWKELLLKHSKTSNEEMNGETAWSIFEAGLAND